MIIESIDDIDNWLKSLDYEAFWKEAEGWCLALPPRADCDRQIAMGLTPEPMVLDLLKSLARLYLSTMLRQRLRRHTGLLKITEH